jgi:hypothetical protein
VNRTVGLQPRTARAEPIYANRPLDAKLLNRLDLVLPQAISASAAIQCFEQPHRFAASYGFRSAGASPRADFPSLRQRDSGPLLVWRWTPPFTVLPESAHPTRRAVRLQVRPCRIPITASSAGTECDAVDPLLRRGACVCPLRTRCSCRRKNSRGCRPRTRGCASLRDRGTSGRAR